MSIYLIILVVICWKKRGEERLQIFSLSMTGSKSLCFPIDSLSLLVCCSIHTISATSITMNAHMTLKRRREKIVLGKREWNRQRWWRNLSFHFGFTTQKNKKEKNNLKHRLCDYSKMMKNRTWTTLVLKQQWHPLVQQQQFLLLLPFYARKILLNSSQTKNRVQKVFF